MRRGGSYPAAPREAAALRLPSSSRRNRALRCPLFGRTVLDWLTGTRPYILTGVVVHIGASATRGHYKYLARASVTAKTIWHEFNDQNVRTVDIEEAVKNSTPYLLVYRRLDPGSASEFPPETASVAINAAPPTTAPRTPTANNGNTSVGAQASSKVQRKDGNGGRSNPTGIASKEGGTGHEDRRTGGAICTQRSPGPAGGRVATGRDNSQQPTIPEGIKVVRKPSTPNDLFTWENPKGGRSKG